MGFLDNTTITVDAILTKVGRKRLSEGAFTISRYALSDEEVDYNLYDVTHPNGTDSYGVVIENMNLMEAIPSRTGFMSYLVHQSLGGATLNIDNLNYTNVDAGTIISITPTTTGAPAEEYSFKISNRNIIKFATSPSSTIITGNEAKLRAQEFGNPAPKSTSIVRVTGVNSGLVAVVNITVNYTPGGSGDGDGPDDSNGDDGGGGGGNLPINKGGE